MTEKKGKRQREKIQKGEKGGPKKTQPKKKKRKGDKALWKSNQRRKDRMKEKSRGQQEKQNI